MRRSILAVGLACALSSTSVAYAADLMPVKAPPPPVEPVAEICAPCILFAAAVIACVLACPQHHHHNRPVTNGAPALGNI
jgi:hypothetical protein